MASTKAVRCGSLREAARKSSISPRVQALTSGLSVRGGSTGLATLPVTSSSRHAEDSAERRTRCDSSGCRKHTWRVLVRRTAVMADFRWLRSELGLPGPRVRARRCQGRVRADRAEPLVEPEPGRLGHMPGQVPAPFRVRARAQGGDHGARVGGDQLLSGQYGDRPVLQIPLKIVDFRIGRDDALGQQTVGVQEVGGGPAERVTHRSSHLDQCIAQRGRPRDTPRASRFPLTVCASDYRLMPDFRTRSGGSCLPYGRLPRP